MRDRDADRCYNFRVLRRVREIFGYRIRASDGEIGHAYNFYFDDATWTVRYVIVNTGDWLHSRRVLISPLAVSEPDFEQGLLPVRLSRIQVENCPPVENDMPVSRREEMAMAAHFGWPAYWAFSAPSDLPEPVPAGNPGLRSVREVLGYRVQASDGDIGHVDDFFVDDHGWRIPSSTR